MALERQHLEAVAAGQQPPSSAVNQIISIKALKLRIPDDLAFDTFGLKTLSVLCPRTADR